MASAYDCGYTEQREFLSGKTLSEAEHVLSERRATVDSNHPANRGATDATVDYVAEMKAS